MTALNSLMSDNKKIALTAHADLSAGMCIQVDLENDLTVAPANNDRLLQVGIVEFAVDEGDIASVVVDGYAYALSGAAITLGSLLDVSADMKCDACGAQTDGNACLRACETATDADELILVKIL